MVVGIKIKIGDQEELHVGYVKKSGAFIWKPTK